MPLLLGQLVYTSFPVVGFRTLASAQVPASIQQVFLQRVVYQYWNSYNPPGLGYRAIYLHQLAPEHTLFGWLYNDGADDMGRSHVPYFVCYYLAEQLHPTQLEIIFTCLHRGPTALIDRQNLLATLGTVVVPDLWSYQPARMGVAIPTEVREHSYIALKQRKLLDLFDEQAAEIELPGQTYEQQRSALSVQARHLAIEGVETGVAAHVGKDTATKIELKSYQEYQEGLQLYEQALVDAVEHESPLSDRTRIRLKLLQLASGLKDEDVASIQARITHQRKAGRSLDQASLIVPGASDYKEVTLFKSPDTIAVREKPATCRTATGFKPGIHRVIPAGRNFQLLIGVSIASVVALVGVAYGLRQWQSRSLQVIENLQPRPIQNLQPRASWQDVQAQTLTGHLGSVWAAVISPDGQTLVSGSEDQTIKVWNLQTGELLRTLSGHAGTVRSVTISPDGQTLVSASADQTIKVWNLQTGELLRTLSGHEAPIWSIAISPDGQTLVSASADQTIKVWNLQTGELLRTLSGHVNWIFSVAISPDGQTLVSGGKDQTIKIWNLQTGKLLRTLSGHAGTVRSVAISPDGQTLVSGGWDQTIKIWNLPTGELLRTLSGHTSRVVSVAVSPDRKTLVSGSLDRTIKIWDLSTGELLRTLPGHADWVLFTAYGLRPDYALRPDFVNASVTARQVFVSTSKDKTIKIWR